MALNVGNAGMALPMGGAVTSTKDSRHGALAVSASGDAARGGDGAHAGHSTARAMSGLGFHERIEIEAAATIARASGIAKLRSAMALREGLRTTGLFPKAAPSHASATAAAQPPPPPSSTASSSARWYGRRKGELSHWQETSLPNGRRGYHPCEDPAVLLLDTDAKQARLRSSDQRDAQTTRATTFDATARHVSRAWLERYAAERGFERPHSLAPPAGIGGLLGLTPRPSFAGDGGSSLTGAACI